VTTDNPTWAIDGIDLLPVVAAGDADRPQEMGFWTANQQVRDSGADRSVHPSIDPSIHPSIRPSITHELTSRLLLPPTLLPPTTPALGCRR
jgi:hypothetical protein